jgi:hypothetical protein
VHAICEATRKERDEFHCRDDKTRDCAMSILRGSFRSVRGYGLRTDETRQGRNAATVV